MDYGSLRPTPLRQEEPQAGQRGSSRTVSRTGRRRARTPPCTSISSSRPRPSNSWSTSAASDRTSREDRAPCSATPAGPRGHPARQPASPAATHRQICARHPEQSAAVHPRRSRTRADHRAISSTTETAGVLEASTQPAGGGRGFRQPVSPAVASRAWPRRRRVCRLVGHRRYCGPRQGWSSEPVGSPLPPARPGSR